MEVKIKTSQAELDTHDVLTVGAGTSVTFENGELFISRPGYPGMVYELGLTDVVELNISE